MTAPEAGHQFKQPVRQIVMMLTVLGLVAAGAWVIYPSVLPVIQANPFLNGMIGLVFLIGVFACFAQVFQLSASVSWLRAFIVAPDSAGNAPRLLAPLAALLGSRAEGRSISSASAGSILDSVATRIEEQRDITRYIVNLLIFLGLLGTFYGLATTVPAVVETIKSLAPQEGDSAVDVFERLTSGLEAQLGGMGTAFGSSLLGLAGSLVVGLLELFAAHGQNRFYRSLEEWLSTITKLGFASDVDTEAGGLGNVGVVLDHMADQMEAMREMYTQSDISRATLEKQLGDLAASVSALTESLDQDQRVLEALERIAAGQERMIEARASAGDLSERGGDAEARMRLRSIDATMDRLLEELAAGRQETVADLRSDLAMLTREIRKGRSSSRPAPQAVAGSGGLRE